MLQKMRFCLEMPLYDGYLFDMKTQFYLTIAAFFVPGRVAKMCSKLCLRKKEVLKLSFPFGFP